MCKKLIILSFLCSISVYLWSIPATPYPILLEREDGSIDTIYLHGDERYHYHTNAQGERIANSEYIDYSFTAASKQHRAPQKTMLTSYVPTKGKIKIPVILVNFSDLHFTIDNPIAQFDDLFNVSGGSNKHATGSVRDYFIASSDSALILEYDIFGPFTLSQPMAYYGSNKQSGQNVTNHNTRAKELVKEAAELAIQNNIDLSPYDNNNDGYIDNISIVVAGYNEAEGGHEDAIWPHYSVISNSPLYSNKYLSGYLIISEYRSSGGKEQAGIGTYCHEFGHALGLPDLYNTNNSEAYTVGEWDIMCSGSYNNNGSTPPSFTAFERFMMGWLTPIQLNSNSKVVLPPIESSNQAIIIAETTHNSDPSSPNPSEFFFLENRQRVGWDAGEEALVASGLLISHITYNRTYWNNNTFNNRTPLGFAIESAGMDEPTQSSSVDIFPGSTNRRSWLPILNNGNSLNDKEISQIRQHNDLSISFQIGDGDSLSFRFYPEEIALETPYLYNPENHDTADVMLYIPPMQQDSIRLYISSNLFAFSVNNGSTWYNAMDSVFVPIVRDSAYTIVVKVIHHPIRRACNLSYAYLSAETIDGNISALLSITGRSPRPTYITTPTIDSISSITHSGFCVTWTPQEDADCYYYMLYTIGAGGSNETEHFEAFTSIEQINEQGWFANFSNLQSTIAENGNAILFNQTGNYIRTPLYLYAPSQISLWLSNNYTPNSSDSINGGKLLIEGTADGVTWQKINTLIIQRTTKNIVRNIPIDTALHMRQFRITYEHLGGNGGTVIDTWTAHFEQNIQYICKLKEHAIYAPHNTAVFHNKEPNTTYYFAIQAYEEKGCEPHYSNLSTPISIHTENIRKDAELTIIRNNEEEYIILLPEIANGKQKIYVYNHNGVLVDIIPTAYGDTQIYIPTEHLIHGNIYLFKYYTDRMKCNDKSAKILYY